MAPKTKIIQRAIPRPTTVCERLQTAQHGHVCEALAPGLQQKEEFRKIRYWPIDKFHGTSHNKHCKYSPRNVPRYAKRLRGVNTQVCEQTFSWFRNYARIMNEMDMLRQHFFILVFVKKHNKFIANGVSDHLCTKRRGSVKKGSYACSNKKARKMNPKAVKAMKVARKRA